MAWKKKSGGWVDEHAGQRVELPADAPTTLRGGGLYLRAKGGGLRVASGTTRDPREILILTPLGPDGPMASVPQPKSAWLVADARRWNHKLHLALALAERQPVSVRADVIAEPLKTLTRQIKLDPQSEPPPDSGARLLTCADRSRRRAIR